MCAYICRIIFNLRIFLDVFCHFDEGKQLCDFLFASWAHVTFPKRKEFALRRAYSFILESIFIEKGDEKNEMAELFPLKESYSL